MTPRTHAEHATATKVATPCTAHHVNYGGGCLNCGWTPRPTDAELVAMLRKAAELILTLCHKDIRKSFHEQNFVTNTLGKAANALEAAGYTLTEGC